MNRDVAADIAAKIDFSAPAVERTIALLDEGAAIPFLARYRREEVGGLSEEKITLVAGLLKESRELLSRQEMVLQSIEEQDAITDELKARIMAASDRAELEDLFLPYRPKPPTRASRAIEAGLAPLADLIWSQESNDTPLEELATPFTRGEKGVADPSAAWQGARDICAERIGMNPDLRVELRKLTWKTGVLVSRLAEGVDEAKAQRYRGYHEFSETVRSIPIHRSLSLRHGEREGLLTLRVVVDREEALAVCRRRIIKNLDSTFLDYLEAALEDAFDRLLLPHLEGEIRKGLWDRAEREALRIIEGNLRRLLMSPPFGARRVMAIGADTHGGFCVAFIDESGALLADTAVAKEDWNNPEKAGETLLALVESHRPEGLALGRSPEGRAGAKLVAAFMKAAKIDAELPVARFSEAEATQYSNSPDARQELPDADAGLRRAVSLGRRMQDPLRELVKIDPRYIGGTALHHHLDRGLLLEGLERVLFSCVGAVGADLNAMGLKMLSYIPGMGPLMAKNLGKLRDEKKVFRTRSELHQVRGMTPQRFASCAAFLRLRDAENPLDATGIHPEHYPLVERMAQDAGMDVDGLLSDRAGRAGLEISSYIDENVGEATLRLILGELESPAKDPRAAFPPSRLRSDINSFADLKRGMKLTGVVTSITDFGAFVDLGVDQDGLVHLSQISRDYVSCPYSALGIGEEVQVVVTGVDLSKNRLSLSIRAALPGAEGFRETKACRGPEGARPRGDGGEAPSTDGRKRGRGDAPRARADGRGQKPPGPRRPRGEEQRREQRPGRRDGPQRQKGPSPYSPFARLKMVDGKIVLDEK